MKAISEYIIETEDSEIGYVTTMFDCMGNETDDPMEAVAVVAILSGGRWLSQEVSPDDFEQPSIH